MSGETRIVLTAEWYAAWLRALAKGAAGGDWGQPNPAELDCAADHLERLLEEVRIKTINLERICHYGRGHRMSRDGSNCLNECGLTAAEIKSVRQPTRGG